MEFEDEMQETKSSVRKILDEINQANIGFENYKKYFNKVKTTDKVISTSIDNLIRNFKQYKKRYTKVTSTKSFKDSYEDGFIHKEAYDLTQRMFSSLLEAYSWKTLQSEMYSIIFTKLFDVLDDARALDIKRDALKEMREMEKKRQEMFIEVMKNMSGTFKDSITMKLGKYDDKLFNLILDIVEEHRKDKTRMFNGFLKITENSNISDEDRKNILEDFRVDDSSRNDRLERLKESKGQNLFDRAVEKEGLIDDDDDDDDDSDDILDDFDDEEDNIGDIEKSIKKKKKKKKKKEKNNEVG